MSQDQAIVLAFKVVEIASVVTITAFIACYSRWAAWLRDPIGRTIVLKDVALLLVLIPSILSIFFSFNRLTSHIAAWFDVGSFVLVPIIMCWRIVVFRKIHKMGGESVAEAENSTPNPLYCSGRRKWPGSADDTTGPLDLVRGPAWPRVRAALTAAAGRFTLGAGARSITSAGFGQVIPVTPAR